MIYGEDQALNPFFTFDSKTSQMTDFWTNQNTAICESVICELIIDHHLKPIFCEVLERRFFRGIITKY